MLSASFSAAWRRCPMADEGPFKRCGSCGGLGYVPNDPGFRRVDRACRDCDSTGLVADQVARERAAAMAELRGQVKGRRLSYQIIGARAGKSGGWVGEVLRGNYPYRGGNHLPRNI